MSKLLLSIAELHKLKDPFVHNNGYICLELDNATQIQVWHPEIRRPYFAIHTCEYTHTIEVCSGRLVHITYGVNNTKELNGTHRICSIKESSILDCVEEDNTFLLMPNHIQLMLPVSNHTISTSQFHEFIFDTPTFTLVTMDIPDITRKIRIPYYLVPCNMDLSKKHSNFRVPKSLLWKYIEQAYPNA